MRDAFLRYSWGLLVILFDFRLGHIDVVADCIGYAMIWSATSRLGEVRSGYLKGKPAAVVLLLLSLHEFAPFLGDPSTKTGQSVPLLVYSSLIMLLMLVMVNAFLLELSRHAAEEGADELASISMSCRWFYIAASAGVLLYLPFTINGTPSFVIPSGIVLTAIGLLTQITLLFTCWRAARELPSVNISSGERNE